MMQTLTSLNALGNKIKYLPIEIGGRTSLKDLQVFLRSLLTQSPTLNPKP
jgi:hypothetical protein